MGDGGFYSDAGLGGVEVEGFVVLVFLGAFEDGGWAVGPAFGERVAVASEGNSGGGRCACLMFPYVAPS